MKIYLHALHAHDPASVPVMWSERLPLLIVKYEPKALLGYLHASTTVITDTLLETLLVACKKEDCLKEAEAYILWKLNRPFDALTILLDELGDVRRAVEFAGALNDPLLWDCIVTNVTRSGKQDRIDALLLAAQAEADRGAQIPDKGRMPLMLAAILAVSKKVVVSQEVARAAAKTESSGIISDLLAAVVRKDALDAKWRLCRVSGGAVTVDIEMEICTFCQRSMLERVEYADGLSHVDHDIISASHEPLMAVFRNGRLVHSPCLLAHTIRSR